LGFTLLLLYSHKRRTAPLVCSLFCTQSTVSAVLPDGCHIKLLNVLEKLLDSAKNLVRSFKLKSAKSSEILLKKLLILR